MKFHALLTDETGCEFVATFEAENRTAAFNHVREEYPESRLKNLVEERNRKPSYLHEW